MLCLPKTKRQQSLWIWSTFRIDADMSIMIYIMTTVFIWCGLWSILATINEKTLYAKCRVNSFCCIKFYERFYNFPLPRQLKSTVPQTRQSHEFTQQKKTIHSFTQTPGGPYLFQFMKKHSMQSVEVTHSAVIKFYERFYNFPLPRQLKSTVPQTRQSHEKLKTCIIK